MLRQPLDISYGRPLLFKTLVTQAAGTALSGTSKAARSLIRGAQMVPARLDTCPFPALASESQPALFLVVETGGRTSEAFFAFSSGAEADFLVPVLPATGLIDFVFTACFRRLRRLFRPFELHILDQPR